MSFTVYKSSAGSGKTFTLVKEYLCIILKNPYKFRSILAITFTNKAADEMKQRVLKSLSLLSDYNRIDNNKRDKIFYLLQLIKKETGLTENEIFENAQKCLSLILHNYSNFAISTIDSFVQKIVRTFTNDLHLPINFSIEMDGENLISQAVDLLVDKLGEDVILTDFLLDFAKTKVDDDKSWHIEADLKNFAKILLDEESQLKIDKLKLLEMSDFNLILNKLKLLIKDFEDKISLIGNKAVLKINSLNISKESFYYGKSGISAYFEKIANCQIDRPNTNALKPITEDKWTSGKATVADKAAIESIKDFLTSRFNEILEILDTEFETYIIRNNILKNIYSLALLNEIEKYISEIREKENTVHISEFQKRIAEIVANEPIPFIYERMGDRFKHFLIDEFQDTSILQWQNLLPLIDNSLAEENFNMIVGDGKQAIYRFRGGEVEQFALLPEIYKKSTDSIANEREKTLIRNFSEKFLKNNYRSKIEIVEFNNQFFEFVSSNLDDRLKIIYNNHYQEYNKENKGGLVNLNFLTNDNEEDYSNQTNLKILDTINELQGDDFQWKDITILCRNNMQANKIAGFLTSQKINVISNESLLLKSSASVRFVVSLLKLILNPNDLISRAHILYYINVEIKNADLAQFAAAASNSLKNSKIDFEKIIIELGYDFSFRKLSNLTMYQLCETLCDKFDLNKQINPYLQFFLDNVLNYTIKFNTNIADFIVWWEKKKDKLALKTPSGLNAVNIMTIHKSKGLEFKVVIFPFADEKQRRTKNSFWIDTHDNQLNPLSTALLSMNENLKETQYADIYNRENENSRLDLINLLYVALTRPSDRLYIFSRFPKTKSENTLSLPVLFKNFLISNSLWNENQFLYSFGVPLKHKKSDLDNLDNMLQMKAINSSKWHEKLLISKTSPENWQTDDPDKYRRFGNLIHWVLSKIENISDLNLIIDNLSDLKVNAFEKNELKQLISKLIDNEETRFLFDKKYRVLNEVEILIKNGRSIRPDKMLISGNEVCIIDFKTGKFVQSHRTQLDKYEMSLQEMGYKTISKCLIYISDQTEIIKW